VSVGRLLAFVVSLRAGSFGEPVQYQTVVGDPFFLDAKHGGVIVTRCDARARCVTTLRETFDGGERWKERTEVVVLPDSGGIPLDGLWIDESTAVLFGTGPMVFVKESGRVVTVKSTFFPVRQLVRSGSSLWAVGEAETGERVMVGDLAGEAWRVAAIEPPPGKILALLPFDGREALVLDAYSARGSPRLLRTTDRGIHWMELTLPCPDAVRLLARDRRHLWLICGSDDSPLSDPDRLHTSPDGGRTWSVARPVPAPRSHGWYAMSRGSRIWATQSRSAGAFEADGRPHELTLRDGREFEPEGFGPVRFADPLHGWISYRGPLYPKRTPDAGDRGLSAEGDEGVWLFRTEDGGDTWEAVRLNPD
jgi:hypothetical protein